MNTLTLYFRSTNVAGWPRVKIYLNDHVIQDLTVVDTAVVEIPLAVDSQSKVLRVERYGKTLDNMQDQQDQIVEITKVTVDNIDIPEFLLIKSTRFEFEDQCHYGTRYFGPNGTWTFEFQTPIFTWILDQKILHEAQYNQDYKYPWSYKLGPDSVNQLSTQLATAREMVIKKL